MKMTLATPSTSTSRRGLLQCVIAIFLTPFVVFNAKASPVLIRKPKYQRVQWKKLEDEPVTAGDLWVCGDLDPNTPERQGSDKYNLQLQAVHPSHYEMSAKDIPRGNGHYWRPTGFVDVY